MNWPWYSWFALGLLGQLIHTFVKSDGPKLSAWWDHVMQNDASIVKAFLFYAALFVWWSTGTPGLDLIGVEAGPMNALIIMVGYCADSLFPKLLDWFQAIVAKK